MIGEVETDKRGVSYLIVNKTGTRRKCGKIGVMAQLKFAVISQFRKIHLSEVMAAVDKYSKRKSKRISRRIRKTWK